MTGVQTEQRTRVLIVEDDASAYAGLRRLLEHYGCEVDYAGTVAEGLKRLDEGPEYVFLDLALPDGEGTRVLERVRMGNLPSRVIIVSGTVEQGVLWRVKSLKPDAVLTKPVDFLRVLELMKPAA
jgi:DNA-binding response OmpR family regulator